MYFLNKKERGGSSDWMTRPDLGYHRSSSQLTCPCFFLCHSPSMASPRRRRASSCCACRHTPVRPSWPSGSATPSTTAPLSTWTTTCWPTTLSRQTALTPRTNWLNEGEGSYSQAGDECNSTQRHAHLCTNKKLKKTTRKRCNTFLMAKLVVYYICMLVLFQDVHGDVFIAVITLSQHDTDTEEWEFLFREKRKKDEVTSE